MNTDVLIIGAGQCGLAMSHELRELHVSHALLDGHYAPGDAWRSRWDSLVLFTPAPFDGLPGMPLPGSRRHCPTAHEFADYLDHYAAKFDVPLHSGTRVRRISSAPGGGFTVDTDSGQWQARRVVIATGEGSPRIPSVASELDESIVQLHTSSYRRPADLPHGRVLVVGCATSGVQLGVELAGSGRNVTVCGKPTPSIPAPLLAIAGGAWFGFIHRVLTRSTPVGRKVAPKVIGAGAPLIGLGVRDLERAGASRGPRLTGVQNGFPQLENGEVVQADAVLWATGYRPGLDWVDGLTLDSGGLPAHERGMSTDITGLAFLGLPFQYGLTSTLIGGAGRDATYVAAQLAA